MVVYYWYIQGERRVAGDYFNKFTIGLNLLFNRRSDGALIRLALPWTGTWKPPDSVCESFARLLIPYCLSLFQTKSEREVHK